MSSGAARRLISRSVAGVAAVGLVATMMLSAASSASAAVSTRALDVRVLLIGGGSSDPTTSAWAATLAGEGVAFTEVDASGSYGSETVTLPALTGDAGTGRFDGVVVADSPAAFGPGQLSAVFSYESTFGVRQVDGYGFPSPDLGMTYNGTGGVLDGTTAQLTPAGLAALSALKGPIPFATGSFGYGATVNAGAPLTPWIQDGAGDVLAGVYQHPPTDTQAGVSELEVNFDYNATMSQWLVLGPGLVDWVTGGTHLGLYRNYFGQDVDDVFISDNEWDSALQCTPSATDPVDFGCPVSAQGQPQPGNPDVQMSAADVDYVVNWETQTGITLNLAFNGIGACSADTAAHESTAKCAGSTSVNGTTYTDPGQNVDPSNPNSGAFVNELLAQQGSFNWVTHTWSHLYLGCTAFQPLPLDHVTAGAGANLAAGSYTYEVTAATAYGESEPSSPQTVTVGAGGSVSLSWPDATNGGGPTLAQEEASHTGGTGFWGYHIYRAPAGSTSFGLIGSVPEDVTGATPTYSFNDTGATTPAAPPESSDSNPTATNPGMGCAGTGGADWVPAASTGDSSIGQEVGLDDAFAANNGLTNFSPASLVTGEHSGLENPNLATALQRLGVTTIAADASRQPQQYNVAYPDGTGRAATAPRYPSNIYYNASNWPDQVNEYNTLYVAPGTPLGTGTETGRCQASSATTCLNTPATEQSILASESSIMLSHVLANNPRIGYAHQSNLIGPATRNGQDYGYTLLGLLSNMLAQYHTWTNAPLEQMTDASSAHVLAEQAAWASTQANNPAQVTAVQSGSTITLTNTGTTAVTVPVTVPSGSTVNGAAFGESYAGTLSDWVSLAGGASETITIPTAYPAFTSPASTSFNINAAGNFTVTAIGTPTPVLTESGALPAGVSFVDNHDGTATISGTPTVTGSFPITLSAANAASAPTQSFTLNVNGTPAITSAGSGTAIVGLGFSYTLTTAGFPAPSLTETGALPNGVGFVDNRNGTATLSGTPVAGSGGSYPLVITATSSAGTTTQNFTLTDAEAPTITTPGAAAFSTAVPQAFTVTTTGYPTATITETGSLPAGVTFTDNGNGTATITGIPATGTTGTYPITITASNPTAGASASQTFSLTVTAASAPLITSGAQAFFTLDQAGGAFAITTKGSPIPAISETGTLPPGLAFVDEGNGTALLSGQPTATGTTGLAITAHNAISPDATQTLTVVVGQTPAFTSPAAVSATAGAGFTFAVTTSGYPAPAIGESGSLPSGMSFTDNGNGTATISGTAATGGVYPLNLTAVNGTGHATQTLLLTVGQAPAVTSASAATFGVGTSASFSVTATGSPAAALSESGPLPAGITFTDHGNGTAALAGTPAPGSGGAYPINISATNSVGGTGQAFTLTVTAAPAITSAPSAPFTVGQPASFTITTSGFPAPNLTESGTLPAGVSFTDLGNGTATLTGTLSAASVGTFPLTISAANSTATVAQPFTLTVTTGTLQITSAASTTFIAGRSNTFSVTATGTTTPTLSERGGLPPGVTFTANTNGSATLSGTPAATAIGVYPINLVATNSTGSTSQAFALTIDQTPTITSPTSGSTITETAGTAFGFDVTTRAYPTATLTESGTLPSGVTFKDNGNGTATISGTAAAGSTTVTVTASNGISPNATTTFTLTAKPAATTGASVPAFTSPATATETVGAAFDFKVTTAASSQSATTTTRLTRSGTLPPGVRFSNNGDGTADITGPATAGGVFPITITATNSAGATTQSFVLTVDGPPKVTSAATATASVGATFGFTVKTSGFPLPAITETGALAAGITFTDNGNGTATLSGTPNANTGGVYKFTVSAQSSFGKSIQTFTLTVRETPAFTSPSSAIATHGQAFNWKITTTGYPAPALTHTGTVPGLTWTNSGTGTLTLSGVPKTAGTYTLTITAANNTGTITQKFTLTVK